MRRASRLGLAVLLPLCCLLNAASGDELVVPLPAGVAAVWDIGQAFREGNAKRERICLNGLWRWQPTSIEPDDPPRGNWGYFKVPGCWPGITDYMQKDCQAVVAHPTWQGERLGGVGAAWYEREIVVPAAWNGRRITLSLEYLNSLAAVHLDGKRVGDVRFPGGELDITSYCRPGKSHRISVHVAAVPLQGVLLSYSDSNAAREVQGRVRRRGLCGDVFLVSRPIVERITEVAVTTSVRDGEVRFESALAGLRDEARYTLRARVTQGNNKEIEFIGPVFEASELDGGRFSFNAQWLPERLWDIHTPGHMYNVTLSLELADGRLLDESFPERFGFREFWIDGKDFYLNGSRIFLSAVPLDNAQVGAAWASYAGARESLRRLKSFGINFVYTHNYGCEPGSHLSFAEILRAADDEGVLVALSQPHFSHYEWQGTDADSRNGYTRHAEFYVRAAQNHPAVVAYSMSHNACGYSEDMNPDMIDGLRDPRSTSYERRNSDRALRAEAIVNRLDPSRIVYHHAGGNLGAMHTVNFYPNFVPIQEMSDWFEHWATVGVKPAFPCEYGAPFLWDWAMYRGWYKGEREFGSAEVPWDFCLAEWNAQFLGDKGFQISAGEKANLRWEAAQFRTGSLWHRWDYPKQLGSNEFEQRYPIIARYITDNWRAFRTWGLSAFSPWQHGAYWRLREGVSRKREELAVDWNRLQQPGFSADFLDQRYERMDLAYQQSDWQPTPAADALLRNNLPLLGYIAGKPQAFTSKDHNFVPGETIEKQAIVINNSRRSVRCVCQWSFDLQRAIAGKKEIAVPTGEQVRIPITIDLPPSVEPGAYDLRAVFEFSDGQTQEDSFVVHVLPLRDPSRIEAKIALFDPPGETAEKLNAAGVAFQSVDAGTDLADYEVLIVGKGALTAQGPAPNIARVRDGLRVVVFEQTGEVLEKRFGFRVAEYGLRWVFPRVPDHPLLSGIDEENLRDWRGSATILPTRLEYEIQPRRGPTVRWCDIEVPRLWRCGNRGNVASVLIEKPVCGDFLPIVDGGFSLQYSPLLEYREGRGMILFCQLDVTARSEPDPAADLLANRVLAYASSWKPLPRRTAVYVGEEAGRQHLAATGLRLQPYVGKLSADQVLVVGPGGGVLLTEDAGAISEWLQAGGHLLAIGLDPQDVEFLPSDIGITHREHIAAYFPPPKSESLLRGVCPADVHNRDPRELPVITSGASIVGDGVLAAQQDRSVVFCAMVPWQFEGAEQWNLKKTHRRSSYLVTRLLANLGVAASTPIIDRFHVPVDSDAAPRWQTGLYVDHPELWDDPYRFFRW